MTQRADIAVIGGGIAGASVAAELAGEARVLLIERETRPGYHTTGRSAALYTCTYGPPGVRALSRASGPAFRDWTGPAGAPLLRRRGVLFIAREDQRAALAALQAEMGGALASARIPEARAKMPLLRADYAAAALWDAEASDIDVDALHQRYLRALKAAGGELLTDAEVREVTRAGGVWRVGTKQGTIEAPVLVNAAGAWADALAQMAGIAPVGLTPKRRTAALIDAPDGPAGEDWPMVVDAEEQFYVKPDAGKLLISPADATPTVPCDAQPEELDVAIAVDRIERAFEISVRRIDHKWAGLRSFVADGEPVAGFAPDAEGFFWLAGQGGYGIQTAPALGQLAAARALGREVPAPLVAAGVDPAVFAPDRPALAA
ncbi:FAD-dependent oxidoreductase [Rhodosalinus halophilus]|uniref:FAD-dependent oxidoreductase n=1 Tax=Rhodosalinus halophilus TaxID=2259333 RepID=A0A365U8J6_9RHOB|nr:FAD-binding oxidoreductase [Rhodosalinus halophilus]RBI85158.1 FAD-dependent oxidoreductase [Rhodosalinus halophilus]